MLIKVSIYIFGLYTSNCGCLIFWTLGLEINEARPHHKLPYRGAWLWVGSGMIHLMELPNPDPLSGRPEHGGRDRHTCISIRDVSKLKTIFDDAGKNLVISEHYFIHKKSSRTFILIAAHVCSSLDYYQTFNLFR